MRNPRSYTDCEELARTRKRKLGHNTYLEVPEIDGDPFAIRFHATRIVTFYSDGRVVLNSGGWLSSTTKERMNRYLPVGAGYISQDRGEWGVGHWRFYDGITYDPAVGDWIPEQDGENPRHLRREVREYASRFLDALRAGDVPLPSGGDCWLCALEAQDGSSWGESSRDREHILSHIREDYFVPSLLVRAVRRYANAPAYEHAIFAAMGHPEARFSFSLDGFIGETVERAISRWCYHCLGLVDGW